MSKLDEYLTLGTGAGLIPGLAGFSFEAMFASMEVAEQKRRDKEAGIVKNIEGFFGVPSKGIEFVYQNISFKNNCYHCAVPENSLYYVFGEEGNILFAASKYEYLGKGVFLVYLTLKGGNASD